LYQICHGVFGDKDPDTIAFHREEKEFKCCQLVELPIGEYDFSLVRHFLFDHAELIRYEMLTESTFQPLAQLAKKVKGEIKYHVMHADSFLKQLAKGTEESHARMQSALTYAMPYALGIFEKSEYEDVLIKEGVFGGEEKLQEKWLEKITAIVTAAGLTLPKVADSNIVYGGRKGYHSKYLEPLLDEMTEVTRSDPGAEW
jgi:ring-1,2-phenylacetyl-CoA epoxidase subunit PaaC